jgi:hypothetical protein
MQYRGMAKMSDRALRRKQLRVQKKRADCIPPLKETLRKLFLRTHPDLFGQFPVEQASNTESYKELMGILDAISNTRGEYPPARTLQLPFFLTTDSPGKFKKVTLKLKTTGGHCHTLVETQLGHFFQECGWSPVFSWEKGSWGLTTKAQVNSNEEFDEVEREGRWSDDEKVDVVAPAYQEFIRTPLEKVATIENVLEELNDIFEIIAAVPYLAHSEDRDHVEMYEHLTKPEDKETGHINGITEIEKRGGYKLEGAIHRIWEGERDIQNLSKGLDVDSSLIVQRILMHTLAHEKKVEAFAASSSVNNSASGQTTSLADEKKGGVE